MGLRCEFNIDSLGLPFATPIYSIPIDYSHGFQVLVDAFIMYSTMMVPVDTGYLQSTLTGYSYGDGVLLETDCDYAEYVEFGTMFSRAQPYFEPAVRMAIATAIPYWDQAVHSALEIEKRYEAIELEEKNNQANRDYNSEERKAETEFMNADREFGIGDYYIELANEARTKDQAQSYLEAATRHYERGFNFFKLGANILLMAIMALITAIAIIMATEILYENIGDLFLEMFYQIVADILFSEIDVEIV